MNLHKLKEREKEKGRKNDHFNNQKAFFTYFKIKHSYTNVFPSKNECLFKTLKPFNESIPGHGLHLYMIMGTLIMI